MTLTIKGNTHLVSEQVGVQIQKILEEAGVTSNYSLQGGKVLATADINSPLIKVRKILARGATSLLCRSGSKIVMCVLQSTAQDEQTNKKVQSLLVERFGMVAEVEGVSQSQISKPNFDILTALRTQFGLEPVPRADFFKVLNEVRGQMIPLNRSGKILGSLIRLNYLKYVDGTEVCLTGTNFASMKVRPEKPAPAAKTKPVEKETKLRAIALEASRDVFRRLLEKNGHKTNRKDVLKTLGKLFLGNKNKVGGYYRQLQRTGLLTEKDGGECTLQSKSADLPHKKDVPEKAEADENISIRQGISARISANTAEITALQQKIESLNVANAKLSKALTALD